MPTEQLDIEEESKKRKIEDVEKTSGDEGVKEPETKKLADGEVVKSTSAGDATKANEDTVTKEKASASDAPSEDASPAAKKDTVKDGGNQDAEKQPSSSTSEDAPTSASAAKNGQTAENDDEVIVVATKNANDSASVAAAVAAASAVSTAVVNDQEAAATVINSIINADSTTDTPNDNTNTHGTTSPNTIENSRFPKLDEASMSGMSQSERKRYREKKRRSEITQAIDKLTKILLKVEPANLFSQNNLVYSTNTSDLTPSRSGRSGGSGQQPLNRTEIINHAVKVLEKLHRENEERKMQLIRLHTVVSDAGGAAGPPGSQHTMMMMPTQPMIYQATPQAIQAVQPIQMQHPSYMQAATAYHVPSSGAPIDTMQNGGTRMVMVPASAAAPPPAAHHPGAPPHVVVANGSDQQRAAFGQFYLSQQFQQQQRMGQHQVNASSNTTR